MSSRLDGSTIFTKSTFSKKGWKMIDLGRILGSSSDTKSIKTCIQEHLFFQHRIFRFFFRCHFLRRLLFVFGRLQTLKIEFPPRREHNFYKIGVFEKATKKNVFWIRFCKSKKTKNRENVAMKFERLNLNF